MLYYYSGVSKGMVGLTKQWGRRDLIHSIQSIQRQFMWGCLEQPVTQRFHFGVEIQKPFTMEQCGDSWLPQHGECGERKEQMTETQKPHRGGKKANPEGNRSSQKTWGENNAKTVSRCQAWEKTPENLELGRVRQENQELEASLNLTFLLFVEVCAWRYACTRAPGSQRAMPSSTSFYFILRDRVSH